MNKFLYISILQLAASLSLANYSFAEIFQTIEGSGTYNLPSGTYDGASSSWGVALVDSYNSSSIEVNVDGGSGTTIINTQPPVAWLLDVYGNYDSTTGGGHVVWNGNISANMKAAYYDFKAVLTNDGNASLLLNGDLNLSVTNSGSHDSFNTFLVASERNSSSTFNGNLNLTGKTENLSGGSISAGVLVNRGENVNMSLGNDLYDTMHIHDMQTNAEKDAESYGIYGYNYEGMRLDYVVNVAASTVIENITASSNSGYSYAAGAEAHGGTINFANNLTIRNINAEESYALAAYNGGSINVNQDGAHTVKIDGDIDVSMENSVINLNLTNGESYIKGAVRENSGGAVNMSLKNGATWHIEGNSGITKLSLDGGNIEVGANGRLEYNSNLTLGGASAMVFHSGNLSNTGVVILGESATVEASETAFVKVVLGEFYKAIDEECSLLLIDTASIVGAAVLDLENLPGVFVWEDSGEEAQGWALNYIEGEGLFANFTPVPEPATYAAIFGASALAFAAYRRRK